MRRQTNPITPHETWLNLFWSKLCIFCGLYFDFVLSPVFRRFVFLHLDTLPRSDFPGSHGAKKHYRLALFWARARQNFWCDFLQGKKVELFSLARFWRGKQKNLSLTLRAREKIWSRLVGKSNINRKRLLTFLNGAISWHNFCNMEQDSQTPRQKAVNTFCFLLPWKKKNCHVLEQSRQNIEMGIVKKTMNREYRNGRFLFEVFLLRYHEGLLSWTSYSITIRQGLFEYPTF